MNIAKIIPRVLMLLTVAVALLGGLGSGFGGTADRGGANVADVGGFGGDGGSHGTRRTWAIALAQSPPTKNHRFSRDDIWLWFRAVGGLGSLTPVRDS